MHRKQIKHYDVSGHAHLLTFSCYRRMPLLTNDVWRGHFSTALDRALATHAVSLIAFVYMPEHLHLLIYPRRETYSMAKLLFSIKRPFSFRIKQMLEASKSPLLRTLTVLDRPGHTSFRFWQEGPGHDRNLLSVEKCAAAAEYIHNNPVRRGLCASPDRWKWSSWQFYNQPKQYVRESGLPRVHGFPA